MAFAIDDLTTVIAHWSADQITGLSDGDPVDSLPDSISGWHLTGTTTARPLYRPTSNINSLPAVEFDGVDDHLVSATTKTNSGAANPNYVIVSQITTLVNYTYYMSLSTLATAPANASPNVAFQMRAFSTGSLIPMQTDSVGASSYEQTVASSVTVGSPYILHVANGISQRGVKINGVRPITTLTGASKPTDLNRALYAHFGWSTINSLTFDGLLSEIVLWDETVASESLYIEGVLAHKYGITLPTTHPFYASPPTSGPPTTGGVAAVHPLGGA